MPSRVSRFPGRLSFCPACFNNLNVNSTIWCLGLAELSATFPKNRNMGKQNKIVPEGQDDGGSIFLDQSPWGTNTKSDITFVNLRSYSRQTECVENGPQNDRFSWANTQRGTNYDPERFSLESSFISLTWSCLPSPGG